MSAKKPDIQHQFRLAAELDVNEADAAKAWKIGYLVIVTTVRLHAIDVYCHRCRLTRERLEVEDPETGETGLVPCTPEGWLNGGTPGERKRRVKDRKAAQAVTSAR